MTIPEKFDTLIKLIETKNSSSGHVPAYWNSDQHWEKVNWLFDIKLFKSRYIANRPAADIIVEEKYGWRDVFEACNNVYDLYDYSRKI